MKSLWQRHGHRAFRRQAALQILGNQKVVFDDEDLSTEQCWFSHDIPRGRHAFAAVRRLVIPRNDPFALPMLLATSHNAPAPPVE